MGWWAVSIPRHTMCEYGSTVTLFVFNDIGKHYNYETLSFELMFSALFFRFPCSMEMCMHSYSTSKKLHITTVLRAFVFHHSLCVCVCLMRDPIYITQTANLCLIVVDCRTSILYNIQKQCVFFTMLMWWTFGWMKRALCLVYERRGGTI